MSDASRYRLVRTIASGGMAQVFEGLALGEAGFSRRVAIKRVLPSRSHDPSIRRMFLDEARIASRLDHGGIVAVLDYGFVDGDEFLVMEYVDGLDLRRAADLGHERGSAIPVGVVLHVISEVAHALDYVRSRCDASGRSLGIVHRDVSPQNILLSWGGDVKLSDFGIATALQRDERTSTGVVKGKMRYMAPEQCRAEPVRASADVYALAATAIECLLQRDADWPLPLTGRGLDEVVRWAWRPPEPLAHELTDLLSRCLADNPSDRLDALGLAERAGRLAATSLARDGRGALQSWLARLRGSATRRSVFDEIVGLCLVPAGPERQFTASLPDGPATAEARPSKPPTAVERRALPRAGRRRAVASALVALVVTTTLVWAGIASVDQPAARRAAAVEPEARAAREPVLPGVSLQPAHSSAIMAGPDGPPTDPPVVASRPRAPATPSGEPSLEAPPAADDAQPGPSLPPVDGWIRIGGPSLLGHRMEIDGLAIGFAPMERALRAGAHRVVVRDVVTGDVLLDELVHVVETHTRTAPLRLRR